MLDALRLVARRTDGRDPRPPGRDPLTERICAALGVADASQIVTAIYSPDFSRARIASLAPEVLAACAEAPEVGERLLVTAGAALAEIVAAAARSLGWSYRAAPSGRGWRFPPLRDDRAPGDDRSTDADRAIRWMPRPSPIPSEARSSSPSARGPLSLDHHSRVPFPDILPTADRVPLVPSAGVVNPVRSIFWDQR